MKPTSPETLPGAGKVARTVKGVLLLLGWILLLAAAVSMFSGWTHLRSAGERTEWPVTLAAGQEVRARFATAAKAELDIELVLSRHEGVSDEVMDAALLRDTNALNIEWQVLREGQAIFSGSSTNMRPFHSGSAAARTKGLGRFMPRKRGQYELLAKVHSDMPELERSHPRIRIRLNRASAMNSSIGGSVGVFVGFVLGLIGVIFILLGQREGRGVGAGNNSVASSAP